MFAEKVKIDDIRGLELIRISNEFADRLIPAIKESESECNTDMERLFWWQGFVSYVGGMISARIGHEAMVDIFAATIKASGRTHGIKIN